MVPSTLQASACDEQLMSIGGEIALSGNTQTHKKNTLQSCTSAGKAKRPLKHAIKIEKTVKKKHVTANEISMWDTISMHGITACGWSQ